jgi:hypothetical protein
MTPRPPGSEEQQELGLGARAVPFPHGSSHGLDAGRWCRRGCSRTQGGTRAYAGAPNAALDSRRGSASPLATLEVWTRKSSELAVKARIDLIGGRSERDAGAWIVAGALILATSWFTIAIVRALGRHASDCVRPAPPVGRYFDAVLRTQLHQCLAFSDLVDGHRGRSR